VAELRPDDERLAAVLASVGEHLVLDEPSASRSISGRSVWRPLLIAAAVLAVLAGAVLAFAPARRAVGDWFGAGSIDVEVDRTADPAGLPAFGEATERIEPSAADDLLGQPMPRVDGTSLGAPSAWWTVPEGGVLVSWPEGDTTLWVTATGTRGDIVKQVIEDQVVTDLPGLGDEGFAITGDHVLQTPHRRVRATAVVAWFDGDLTFRLDGTGDIDDLIAVAEQISD
jgi:hypothetical protein